MYHINPDTKNVGPCGAEKGRCPFGGASGAENHFESQDAAYREVERRLSEEYGNPSLSKEPKMIDSFDVWKAKQLGVHKESPSSNGIPLSYYRSMLPPQHGEMARYCHEKGLSLEETAVVSEMIKRFKNPFKGGPSVLVTRALQARIAEAENNCKKIDETLIKSGFFNGVRTQQTKNGITLITYATVDQDDYIVHMSENGSVRFEVYDHEDGQSYYSLEPRTFTDPGNGAVATWIANYNAYREHLWSRTLWEREKRNRVARAGSLNL